MTTIDTHPSSRTLSAETALRCLLFIMIVVGGISFFEPSPYEFVFFVFVPTVILLNHVVLTRVTLALLFFIVAFSFCEMLSLVPYFGERPVLNEDGVGGTATVYTLQTMYLGLSAMVFAVVFTRNTAIRVKLALIAYTISTVLAASWAVAGHFEILGLKDSAAIVGRAAGPFKDPNVLGSYSILGALYLMQCITNGPSRWRLLNLLALAVTLFGGIFLPLSRGAWGAMILSMVFFGIVTYLTADGRRMRRNLIVGALGLLLIVGMGAAYIASDPTLRSSVTDRAKVEQDYDGGITGRFGNQMRSLPMLLERPLGFGPHRFAFYFDLDPHDSYIGAFASAGWIGGLTFFLFFLVTSIIAIRLAVIRTPYLRHAQVIAPALVSAFLQAFQIDIDHWRFIYLMIGAIWGMEANRLLSQSRSVRQSRRSGLPSASRDRAISGQTTHAS